MNAFVELLNTALFFFTKGDFLEKEFDFEKKLRETKVFPYNGVQFWQDL